MVSGMTVTPLPLRRGWVPDDANFGARLAMVRQHLGGLNITKAAETCGVNPESWRTWEAGKTKPRDLADIAGKIARATGVDYVWMMLGSAVPEAVAGGREAAAGGDYPSSGVSSRSGANAEVSGYSANPCLRELNGSHKDDTVVVSLAGYRGRRAGVAA